MNIALWIYICLACFGLGIGAARHGEERTGEHNIYLDLVGFIIGIAFGYFIAIGGGFP